MDNLAILISELNNHGVTFDAICLQETWIKSHILPPSLNLNGYQAIHQQRHCSEHGGLLIFLRENYTYDLLNLDEKSDVWESQFIKVKIEHGSNDNLLIGNIYRPPHKLKSQLDRFSNQMNGILSKCSKYKNVVLTGDFNLNLLDINSPTSSAAHDFFGSIISSGFLPKITLPTRITDHSCTLIDNFFCKLRNDETSSGILIRKISDHQAYFTCLQIKSQKMVKNLKIKVRKITQESMNAIGNDIIAATNSLQLDTVSDPNQKYNSFLTSFQNSLSQHAPIREVNFNRHKHKGSPWITTAIVKSIKERDKLYCKVLKAKLNSNKREALKLTLKLYNRILQNIIRKAKSYYYNMHFRQLKHDIKKTWKAINEILNKKPKATKLCYPKHFSINNQLVTDKTLIAEEFNSFFTSVGRNLASSITHNSINTPNDYLNDNITTIFQLETVTEADVSKIIRQLKPVSSCGHDNITPKLLKALCPHLVIPLTLIINQAILSGIFPDSLKRAKVVPIHKKDDDSLLCNYRPISLLPAISKVFEKVIHNQLQKYLSDNNLLYPAQYGFRPKHSTELAALHLLDMLSSDLDANKIPINIYLDLSKAFDTINHKILLSKLNYYGITGTALKLLESYLTNRTQFVSFDGCHSGDIKIDTGVPQGSILGPLLFIIYINDLYKTCSSFLPIIYADDTTLYKTLDSNDPSQSINDELEHVNLWLKINKLSLNITKTQYMVFHKPRKRLPALNIEIDSIKVKRCTSFNFLGIHLNQHFTWSDHLKSLSIKISRATGRINCLKHFLPKKILLTIYNTIILPHLNYGILAWGAKSNEIAKLQKKAIRVVTNSKFNAHTEPLFKNLHLLKVEDIYKLHQLNFFFKKENGNLPVYFDNFRFQTNRDTHPYETRRTALIAPRLNHEFAKLSLRHNLIKLLNDTPSAIKDKVWTHSFHSFSSYTKKHFLNAYSNTCTDRNNCYVCIQNIA
jgi:hypothetical protein